MAGGVQQTSGSARRRRGRRLAGTAPPPGGPSPRRADPLHGAHGRPEPPLTGGCLLRARGRGDGAERPRLHRHLERRSPRTSTRRSISGWSPGPSTPSASTTSRRGFPRCSWRSAPCCSPGGSACSPLGRAAAVAGVACLLATPIFVDNARRLMMEVPSPSGSRPPCGCTWRRGERPRWQLALAVPLGAAILTKSVLGLMPLSALVGALASEELRAPLRRPWVWIGLALGLAIGAVVARTPVVDPGIGSGGVAPPRARGPAIHAVLPSRRPLRAYPLILLKFYQPLILPGLLGLWLCPPPAGPTASRRRGPGGLDHPPARALQPRRPSGRRGSSSRSCRRSRSAPAMHSSRSSRASPHLHLDRAGPRRRGRHRPPLLVDPVAPHAGPERRLQAERATIQALAPAGESVPYLGNHYWASANPLLYYAERVQAPSSPSAREAVEAAQRHPGRLLTRDAGDGSRDPGGGSATSGRPGGTGLGPAAPRRRGRRFRRLEAARGPQGCSRRYKV